MEPALRILHLEDDPVDAQLVLRLLREGGLDVQLDRVRTFVDFEERLKHNTYALILSDYTVPGVDVLKAMQLARQVAPGVPFVFLAGTLGEETAIETLRMGATDYVLKQCLGRLVPAVRRALQEAAEQSRRKQAEADLRKAFTLLRAVTEGVTEAIFVKDDQGRYLMINGAEVQRLGKTTPTEALNKYDRDFFPTEVAEAIWEHDREVMASGKAQTYEETRLVAGVPRVFLTSKAPYYDHEGKIIGVLGIAHDITERKQAEEEIRHLNETLEQRVRQRTQELNEANANLESFAHTAAHDLRSPLRAIGNFASLALTRYGAHLDGMMRSLLERINQSAEQMGQLLTDLLEFSKINQTKLNLEPVRLQNVLPEALSMLETDIRAKNAVISVQSPMPTVLGHSATLVLLINNFLSNALKFIPDGVQPQIRISAEEVDPSLPGIQAADRAASAPAQARQRPVEPKPLAKEGQSKSIHHFIRLSVQDNGIGIAAEDLDRIFGVFQRLHGKEAYPGTGLGLAIVKKAAERMGGRVGVESTLGHGSRFWLELPAADNLGEAR